jgi:hypothetical protein
MAVVELEHLTEEAVVELLKEAAVVPTSVAEVLKEAAVVPASAVERLRAADLISAPDQRYPVRSRSQVPAAASYARHPKVAVINLWPPTTLRAGPWPLLTTGTGLSTGARRSIPPGTRRAMPGGTERPTQSCT